MVDGQEQQKRVAAESVDGCCAEYRSQRSTHSIDSHYPRACGDALSRLQVIVGMRDEQRVQRH
jgi:hypothetical protein